MAGSSVSPYDSCCVVAFTVVLSSGQEVWREVCSSHSGVGT